MTTRKRSHTQWAGQFGVAHELARRGYLVAFTTGNTPGADLLCESPTGSAFSVEVKSLAAKNFFLYQASHLEPNPRRFFVFVLFPPSLAERPEYFVLDNAQFLNAVNEQERVLREREKERGRPFAEFSPGIHHTTLRALGYVDTWNNLPS